MAEFTLQPSELPMERPNTDQNFKNVKEFRASDGSFAIKDGKTEFRDTSGNIVILIDPNG